jgi:catechol 2,3-dioxygenase-like lactoylglutathione lyase family enzyme
VITGLNHITLAVSDIERSLHFYIQLLGFSGHVKWDNGAYLSAGSLWLCLSRDKPSLAADYSHIAFDISESNFDDLSAALKSKQVPEWKINKSEGRSLYILDPDGHKLEIHVGGLASRLAALKNTPYAGLEWL